MFKKYFFSSLLTSLTLFAAEPPTSKEDKAKKELQELAEFHTKVYVILKQQLPNLKVSYHRISNNWTTQKKYGIVLPKNTVLEEAHKQLILDYLDNLDGGIFAFVK